MHQYETAIMSQPNYQCDFDDAKTMCVQIRDVAAFCVVIMTSVRVTATSGHPAQSQNVTSTARHVV